MIWCTVKHNILLITILFSPPPVPFPSSDFADMDEFNTSTNSDFASDGEQASSDEATSDDEDDQDVNVTLVCFILFKWR